MALYKFAGTSEKLAEKEINSGYIYATVDDPTEFLAQLHLDIGSNRYRLAAATLIDEDGNLFDMDSFVRTTELPLAVSKGGTGSGNLTDVHNNLQIYSRDTVNSKVDEATTKAIFDAVIDPNDIVDNVYTYTNAQLRCGKDGNVPPIITYQDNQEEYSYIDSAMATAGVGITFHFSQLPTNNIPLIIIDNA